MEIGYLKDERGRITRWPKKKAEKIEILKYLRTKFDDGIEYSEKLVNKIINAWHVFGDYALLRREMYDNYLIERTKDGRKYWIDSKKAWE